MALVESIEGYSVHKSVGQGGMSSIYHATEEATGREVAIKMLRLSFLHDPHFIERFRREADALTALRHPAIVPIFTHGDINEVPYIVMQYMPAGSLKERIHTRTLTIDEIITITEQVASALDYMHDQGIIHRDVKPSNILFTEAGDAHLSDFGLVRMVDASGHLTGSGVVGTPAYMAPENSELEIPTHTADVYSLGVVLYEMLAGEQPFAASTPIATLLSHMTSPLPKLDTEALGLPKDVERVLHCALAKDQSYRYDRAGHLATDLRAAVEGRPLLHYIEPPDTTIPLENNKKRSNLSDELAERDLLPIIVGIGGLLIVVIAIALITQFGPSAVADAPTESVGATATTTAAAVVAPTQTRESPTPTITPTQQAMPPLSVARSFGKGTINDFELTPDGQVLLLATSIGVYAYDAATSEELWFSPTTYAVSDISPAPNSRALVGQTTNGRVAFWAVADGSMRGGLEFNAALPTALAWGGAGVAVGFDDGTMTLVSAEAAVIDNLEHHSDEITHIAWSPDGQRVATASLDGTLAVYTPSIGGAPLRLTGHGAAVFAVAWSPDGSLLLSGANSGEVFLWDADNGRTIDELVGHTGGVRSVAWSRGGATVATGSVDSEVLLWNVTTRQQRASFDGHDAAIASLIFQGEGGTLISGGRDSTILFWDVVTSEQIARFEEHGNIYRSLDVAAGGTIAAGTEAGAILLLQDGGDPVGRLRAHNDVVTALDFTSPRLVSGGSDGRFIVWELATSEWLVNVENVGQITSVAYSPDRTLAAAGLRSGVVVVWDAQTGRRLLDLQGHASDVLSLAWSPDNTRLVSGSSDQTAIVWEARTGARLLTFGEHDDDLLDVAWSPDSRRIASAGADARLIVWDPDSGQVVEILTEHTNSVSAVDWSFEGDRLASGSTDGTLIVWEVATWNPIASQRGHTATINDVAFGPGGGLVYTVSEDGTLLEWLLNP